MKFKQLIAATIFATSLAVSFVVAPNKEATQVEAAVGSYSRNQQTYYTSDFSHKVTSSSYGTSLLTTLHELMYDSHKTYNTYADLWDYTKYSDYDTDNPDNIILLYSRQSIDGTGTPSSWNREHVWCKSLSGDLYKNVSSTTTGAGSDLHHLRPASTIYNSERNNNPYGIVATHDSSTKMGDTDCYYSSSIFEPADYIKGDVARILMYMYAHYSNEISGTSTKSGALSIANIVTTSAGTTQAAWDLLMDWNESDPVDYQEMIRNNKCAYYLGNFNPFIDHPEYARMIWDDSSTYQAGLCFQTSYKTVNVGSSYTNTASAWGNVSSSGTITYTSDNPSIATVSSSGTVTGVSNGVARIKARATVNGISRISYHFVVVGSGYTPKYTMNASGVVYTPTSATSARASATLGSETVAYNNTYTTSGYHTQITGGKTATLTINNFPKTIKSMILSMHSTKDGGSCSLTVTVGGSSYYSKSGTFASIYGSYSQSFVPIDVTNSSASKKTGTIVITINNTGSKSIYFEKAIIDYTERIVTQATSIAISPSSFQLTPGEDNALITSFTPSNTTLQTVTWNSSNTSIATVNNVGLVKAVTKGTTTITATAKDGSGVIGIATINVVDEISGGGDTPSSDPAVNSVVVSPATLSLDLNGTTSGNLTATVNVSNGASQAVSWGSSNTGVATVSNSGAVTAVSIGTATITATSTFDGTKSGSCTVTVIDSSTSTSNYTWDLTAASYSSSSTDQVSWESSFATMVVTKETATTNANNYLPTTQGSSRFYKNSKLTFTPLTGYTITSIEATATTTAYATALGTSSTWTGATASVSSTVVTITPANGNSAFYATIGATTGLSQVTVNYVTSSSQTVSLSSISLNTTNAKTDFVVGETFTYSGLVVTAHYSDNSEATVSPTSVSSPDMSTTGNKTITVSYTESNVTRTSEYQISVVEEVTSITATVGKTFYVGETITSSDITVEDNLGNEITGFAFSNDNYQFKYSDASSGGSLTSKTFTNSITYSTFTCSLTVQVQRKARVNTTTYSDNLTRSVTGISGTQYNSWSNKTLDSGATYAGQSAGGNDSIQLRSNNSNSGIVTTAYSGTLYISSITVSWYSGTDDARTLNIYGDTTAYTNPTELYGSPKGTLLGTINKGTGTTLSISGSYQYIGIRSASGALYLESVTITYGSGETPENVANYIMYEDTNNQCTSKFNTAKGYFEGLTAAQRNTFMTSSDYVISTARERLEAWARHQGKTIDIVNGDYSISNISRIPAILNNSINNTTIIVVVTVGIAVIAIGGYFLLRKKKED